MLKTHTNTVVHILLECQQYNTVRQKYFSVTTVKELFDTVNSDDILSFLRDIRLYSSIYMYSSFVLWLICFVLCTLTLNILLFFHF